MRRLPSYSSRNSRSNLNRVLPSYVCIEDGRLDLAVSEQLLNVQEIGFHFDEVSREE
ncbi:MAG: hypothetical protein IH968_10750 [Gemmatimonadetes bacterium]|nr:hypothetical protein [Gemmatimonadota bacterium]